MAKQVRIALRNCGRIDPDSIKDYIANRGYEALVRAITEQKPEDIVQTVLDAGLRGRGGGGFPTGLKWKIAAQNKSEEKFVICNADEGDPGAFMDRAVIEGDPHSVLEAMALAGYGIGADKGVIYIRAEYPLAVQRLHTAIKEATDNGLLGKNILGTNFSFEIRVKLGAGAFVCGEETSLIHSIEGLRGEPTVKPPFPAEKGLWKKPTIVNNVETYANISPILLYGADWFKKIGRDKSPGTKVFALAGKVNKVGLVEVPMGTTIREVIYDIGGGIFNNKQFKSVQTGGPSGGCITKENLDTPITYENLLAIDSMMGSGGMIVMDEDDCMVNVAKFYLEFIIDESCGKCTPCRVGNKRLHEMLVEITSGRVDDLKALDDIKNLCAVIKKGSLCGLGQTSPNPVLSTIRFFGDEYRGHILDKKCKAGVCRSLLKYEIIKDKCIGCTLCARNCPVNCISGKTKEVHIIDASKCIKCGVCYDQCKFGAVKMV